MGGGDEGVCVYSRTDFENGIIAKLCVMFNMGMNTSEYTCMHVCMQRNRSENFYLREYFGEQRYVLAKGSLKVLEIK